MIHREIHSELQAMLIELNQCLLYDFKKLESGYFRSNHGVSGTKKFGTTGLEDESR